MPGQELPWKPPPPLRPVTGTACRKGALSGWRGRAPRQPRLLPVRTWLQAPGARTAAQGPSACRRPGAPSEGVCHRGDLARHRTAGVETRDPCPSPRIAAAGTMPHVLAPDRCAVAGRQRGRPHSAVAKSRTMGRLVGESSAEGFRGVPHPQTLKRNQEKGERERALGPRRSDRARKPPAEADTARRADAVPTGPPRRGHGRGPGVASPRTRWWLGQNTEGTTQLHPALQPGRPFERSCSHAARSKDGHETRGRWPVAEARPSRGLEQNKAPRRAGT